MKRGSALRDLDDPGEGSPGGPLGRFAPSQSEKRQRPTGFDERGGVPPRAPLRRLRLRVLGVREKVILHPSPVKSPLRGAKNGGFAPGPVDWCRPRFAQTARRDGQQGSGCYARSARKRWHYAGGPLRRLRLRIKIAYPGKNLPGFSYLWAMRRIGILICALALVVSALAQAQDLKPVRDK